ncbi:hypothetical protein [Desulfovibrio ferrophilus]|uniref:Histidine kinase n=1 Tax=Desulfovibrio ferrophilus TaxID=241368 RepID=A0A2Z6AZH1_9BACT|nr:hypothetical protein [Desulfovibrio ferrophilus]BBD08642.1 histidine kinase [Desulfovibrio ferrophilus]
MIKRLLKYWRRWRDARRLERQIAPKVFVELSAELKDLARTASKVRHDEPEFQTRVTRIQKEMKQLGELAGKPEFRRLTTAKRLELRKSLLLSKAQLLESMHNAEPPTDTLQ